MRVQTTLTTFRFVFLPEYQRQRKCLFSSEREQTAQNNRPLERGCSSDGIQTHGLCVSAAVLYRLSYKANAKAMRSNPVEALKMFFGLKFVIA